MTSFILILILFSEYANAQISPILDLTNQTDTVETTSPEDIGMKTCAANCIFTESVIDSASMNKFPKNCATVCASPLYIGNETDLTEKQLTNALKNMKHLIGELIVSGSKFKTGKFLAALETIDCDNTGYFQWTSNDNLTEIGLLNLKTIACRIEINSNKMLTKLNLPNMVPTPSLTANYSRIDVEISNNSATLCVTVQEMANLVSNQNVDIRIMPQSYCSMGMNSSTEKTCGFENSSLSTMESGCVRVCGDVKIELNDEEHTHKLKTVKKIFGSLTIDGTNLTNIDFLDGLESVVALKDDEAAIRVQYNPNLSNVSFPSLKRVYADISDSIVFQNNSEELLMDPSICWGIRKALNTTDASIPTIDGQQCEKIDEDAIVRDKSGKQLSAIFSIVFFFVLLLSYS